MNRLQFRHSLQNTKEVQFHIKHEIKLAVGVSFLKIRTMWCFHVDLKREVSKPARTQPFANFSKLRAFTLDVMGYLLRLGLLLLGFDNFSVF